MPGSSLLKVILDHQLKYFQTTEPWTKFGTVQTLSGETSLMPTACAKPSIFYEVS